MLFASSVIFVNLAATICLPLLQAKQLKNLLNALRPSLKIWDLFNQQAMV
jgi:hypothetical protein